MSYGRFKPKRGKKRSHQQKPRYFVFRKNEPGWQIGPKKPLHIPLKLAIPLAIFLFLALSVGVAQYQSNQLLGFTFAPPEYNGQTHTRTPILTHTTTVAPTGGLISFRASSKLAIEYANNPAVTQNLPSILVTSGDTEVVILTRIGVGAVTVSDSLGTSFTQQVTRDAPTGGDMTVRIFTGTVSITASDVVSFQWATQGAIDTIVAVLDYSGVSAIGTSGSNQNTGGAAVSLATTITVGTNSWIAGSTAIQTTPPQTFTEGSGQTQRQTGCIGACVMSADFGDKGPVSGSQTFTQSWTNGASATQAVLELQTTGVLNFAGVRWNFNSTCVVLSAPGNYLKFDYSLGTTGSGGNNCNTADIAIMKAPVNLQTVSERMLEIDQSWVNEDGSIHALNQVALFFRTNGTLPAFSENYLPENDPSVRMLWIITPSYIGNGQNIFIVHDAGKSLLAETTSNDQLFPTAGVTSDFTTPSTVQFQTVLNYTGALNLIEEAQSVNAPIKANSTAVSGLQNGQSYYVGVKAYWITTKDPGTCSCDVKFASGATLGSPALPKTFQIFTVPALCDDPANKSVSPCASTPEPFSPFDPSTWGNAAIAGLGWVGNQAVGLLGSAGNALSGFGNSIMGAIASAIIGAINTLAPILSNTVSLFVKFVQGAMNAIGAFFGWGNIGDQFISFASGILTYFTTGLGDALSWLVRLILRSVDLIKIANFWVNFYLTGLFNVLADALNVIAEVIVFAGKIVTFLGSSYVLILILFFLWYDADMGLSGWHAWFETVKWFAFISFDFLERMINFGISSVTWMLGRIPTLDGTTLPELPTIAIGGGPIWPTTEMTALREGNMMALFGQLIGTGFLVWFETSGLPGSIGSNVTGTAAGVMAPFVTILLILISVMGLLFVLHIPAQLARGTFGLNDLGRPSMSSFSTGPISTGGVSGRLVRRHPERKAKIVVHHGLGIRGLRPHLRKPKSVVPQPSSQGVG